MNISLPKSEHDRVKKEVARGGFASVSEYFRHVLREDRKRRAEAQARLEELLLEGIRSGPAVEMTKADWDDIKARARARLKGQRKKAG